MNCLPGDLSYLQEPDKLHNSFVRGYHFYKDEWTPTVGESWNCTRELENIYDNLKSISHSINFFGFM